MRAIWKGSISFGLANIPVRLFSASESVGLDLDMLHEKDLSPIRYAKICKEEGQEVPYQQIVKGFHIKGKGYVVVSEEDFKKANVKKTSTIAIYQFAGQEEILPIYYEKPYYLAPEKGAEQVYSLFLEALRESKKVGIGKFVLRNREKLVALYPGQDGIILNQLRFESEIRDQNQLEIPLETANKDQIEVAMALISQLTRKFNPAEFKDTYILELKKLIKDKAEGKEIKTPTYKPQKTQDVDALMKALRESLESEKAK